MGQPANLVIVQDGAFELYYSHWCANTLPGSLFWGAKYAAAFIRAQSKADSNDWLDDIWAEGGVVLDSEKKVLLFFGGEDERFDIPHRRLFIQLMGTLWTGWQINWAHNGIVDIAGYVGVPPQAVLSNRELECSTRLLTLEPPEEKEWTDLIASIRFDDGEKLFFPLSGSLDDYLSQGSDMLRQINRSYGYERLDLKEWSHSFPQGGFHIDELTKRVHIWNVDALLREKEYIRKQWEGWVLCDEGDSFETHATLAGDALLWNQQEKKTLLTLIRSALLAEHRDPRQSVASLVEKLRAEGKKVEATPAVMLHGHYVVPRDVRERLLKRAVRGLDKKQGPLVRLCWKMIDVLRRGYW